jgi:hypothetical protein
MRVSIVLPHHVETSALIVQQQRSSIRWRMTIQKAIEEEEDTATIGTATTAVSRRRRFLIAGRSVASARRTSDAAVLVVVGVQANAAKAMWSVLEPLLFRPITTTTSTCSSVRIAAATVLWLLEWAQAAGATPAGTATTNSNSSCCCCYCSIDADDDMFDLLFSGNQQQNTMKPPQQQRAAVQKRRLKFRVAETTRYLLEQQQQQSSSLQRLWSRHVCLLLQPYHSTRLEYAFAGRLIRWEHQLIQAQSLNGYVSTLGGGFFLCHHFATAIYLARHQQRLAVYLHRPDLYWTCWIHMAYSHVYAGHFRTARRILTAVERAIHVIVADRDSNYHNDSDDDEKYSTLLAMCQSAQLHWKRMKQTATTVGLSSLIHSKRGSTTNIDDFVRVRVVGDKSKQNDLSLTRSLLQRY